MGSHFSRLALFFLDVAGLLMPGTPLRNGTAFAHQETAIAQHWRSPIRIGLRISKEDAMPGRRLTRRTGNRLLDRLPEDEFQRLLPSWETISLPHGHELCRQNGPMSHVYFPTSGMCSVVGGTKEGKVVETATVGNEGMIGIPVFLGLDFSPSRAISQVSGTGLRMPAPSFLRALEARGALDRLLRRFIGFSLRYAYQTVACNAQ